MADKGSDFCEYIWNHEFVMQRLLSMLQQGQNYCTDNECFSMSQLPGPRNAPPSSNFFTTCLIIIFAVLMYVLRSNCIRQLKNDIVKDRDNENDPNDDPPVPPPTAY
ncbi:PREDICTED: small integral membrane protein 14 isoform X2 [Eufriesea mexicana]|nr:PREDICTED: small integral membrane protein 14 isoform X2 [Eufriesea mexicana]